MPLETPLLELHRSARAEIREYFGTLLPSRFGDFTAEYSAARETVALVSRPVWLFSSGPVTDGSKPDDPADRRQGDKIAESLAAREHRVFRARLDKGGLSVGADRLAAVAACRRLTIPRTC